MQNQSTFKKLTSLNVEVCAAEMFKQKLLRKASSAPEQMMEEFLTRQALYEKLSNPILKMEAARIQQPVIKPSKLRDAVHQARNRYMEIQRDRNSQEIRKPIKRNSLTIPGNLEIQKPEKRNSLEIMKPERRNSLQITKTERRNSLGPKPEIYYVSEHQNPNFLIYFIITFSLLGLLVVLVFG